MADEVARMYAVLEARTTQLEKGFAKAVKTVDKTAQQIDKRLAKSKKEIESRFADLGSALSGAFAGVSGNLGPLGNILQALGRTGTVAAVGLGAAALAAKGLFAAADQSIKYAAAINDTANRTGVAVEALQELRFAFADGGVAVEQTDDALEKLNQRIGDAAGGSKEAAATFAALGVDIRDAAGNVRPVEAVLSDVADAFAAIKDPAARASAATDLFGRGLGASLIPVLAEGSQSFRDFAAEARRMGAVISAETVAKAAELDDQFEKLALTLKAKLAEALVKVGPELVKIREEIADALPRAVSALADILVFCADNFEILAAAAAAFVAVKIVEFAVGAAAAFTTLATAIKGVSVALIASPIGLLAAGLSLVALDILTAAGAFDEATVSVEDLQKQINTLAGANPEVSAFLDAVEAGGFDAAKGLDEMSDAAKRALIALADLELAKVNAESQPMQGLRTDIRQEATDAFGHDAAMEIERQAQAMAALKLAYQQGRISQSELDAGIVEMRDHLVALTGATISANQAVEMGAAMAELDPLIQRADMWMQVKEAAEAALAAEDGTSPGYTPGGGGGGGGSAAAKKNEQLKEYLRGLHEQVALLGLTNIALAQAQGLIEAKKRAQEDYNNKLRESADLTAAETQQVLASIQAIQAVPAIASLVLDDPVNAAIAKMRELQEMQEALANPDVMAALEQQGITAEQAYAGVADAMSDAELAASGLGEIGDQAGQIVSSGLHDIASGAKTAEQALLDMVSALLDAIAQALIFIPLQNAITGAVGSLFGGGAGAVVRAPTQGVTVHAAKGGIFDRGNVVPFARGGIVNRPTLFPMATGAGLMGEAGPEAILPLARGAGGRLGVRASGAGGGMTVVLNDYRSPDDPRPETQQRRDSNGNVELQVTLRKAMNDHLASGGADQAMSRFGSRPQARR